MTKRTMAWSLALALLLPSAARGQQNPALIGEGAQVYANNCGRCHNARSSTERGDAQWTIIVQHMRARASLTGAQARAVLAYLQATNLPEGAAPGGGDSATGPAQASAPHPEVVIPPALQDMLLEPPLQALLALRLSDPGRTRTQPLHTPPGR
ncbi:MAG TPA: hypothetical protein VE173_12175 [Longimicrobiales bacterium]|nr:hypothetical protein [Longimicrobiales bacterium]